MKMSDEMYECAKAFFKGARRNRGAERKKLRGLGRRMHRCSKKIRRVESTIQKNLH